MRMKPTGWRHTASQKLRLCIGMALVSVALAACDGLFGPSTEEQIGSAREALSAGRYQESLVYLKSVLQEETDQAEARALLGLAHLALYDLESAEKELLRARDLGAPAQDYLPWLGRTWLTMGKADQVVEEIRPEAVDTPDLKAALLTVVGKAKVQQVERQWDLQRLAEAEAAFQQALQFGQPQPEMLAGLGRVAFYEGDISKAEDRITAALSLAPGNVDALVLEGDLAMWRGEAGAAVEAFSEATNSDPFNPFVLMGLAWAQLAAGRAAEAIPNIERLLKAFPPNRVVNYQRALAAHMLDDREAELRYSEQALAFGDHLPSLLLAGSSAYALGRYELAFDYLQGYVAAVPEATEARRLLAAASLQLGQVQKAVDSLAPLDAPQSTNDARLFAAVGDAAIRAGIAGSGERMVAQARAVSQENSAALTGIGRTLIKAGNTGQAIEDLERAVELDPANANAHALLIVSYLSKRELDKALAAAIRFQKALPDNPRGFVLEGIVHGLKNDLFQSRTAFEQALKIQPGEPDAANNLAALLLRGGDRDGARRLYESVLEHDPSNLKTLINYGNLELQAGNTSAAISMLQTAVKAHGDGVEAPGALGSIYIDTKQPQAALDVARPALDKHPSDPTLLNIVGKAYLELGQNQQAIEAFRRLNQLRPELVFPSIYLAQAYGSAGDLTKAVQTIEDASAANPDSRQLKMELARLQGVAGRLEDANRTINELKQAAPDSGDLAELEAMIALAEGNPERAVASLQQVPQEKRNNYITIQLAKALLAAGRSDEAFGVLETWLKSYPQDMLTRTVLAGSYLQQGQLDAAQSHYATLLSQDPESTTVLNNLAWVKLEQGDAEGALPHARKARELQPGNPSVADTLGVVLLDLDRNEEALPLLEEAHAGAAQDPVIATHYARALAGAERREEALQLLRRVLSSELQFSNRDQAESLLQELGG